MIQFIYAREFVRQQLMLLSESIAGKAYLIHGVMDGKSPPYAISIWIRYYMRGWSFEEAQVFPHVANMMGEKAGGILGQMRRREHEDDEIGIEGVAHLRSNMPNK